MFKVLMKRTVPPGKEAELVELITQLRVAVSGQDGYISGETLKSADKPNEYLVISVWDREESWKAWRDSDQRKAIHSKIDAVLGKETIYETYQYPHATRMD